jgi:hypothetical protein
MSSRKANATGFGHLSAKPSKTIVPLSAAGKPADSHAEAQLGAKRHRPKTGKIRVLELDSWLAFARLVLI